MSEIVQLGINIVLYMTLIVFVHYPCLSTTECDLVSHILRHFYWNEQLNFVLLHFALLVSSLSVLHECMLFQKFNIFCTSLLLNILCQNLCHWVTINTFCARYIISIFRYVMTCIWSQDDATKKFCWAQLKHQMLRIENIMYFYPCCMTKVAVNIFISQHINKAKQFSTSRNSKSCKS